ncbi:hypothetical protein FRC02_000379 [Tulasnella sp. 418]|nr:hypothetical protein FRC02_000379 [Tulasnella sp. 418]
MKLTLRAEWRPRAVSSFLGFLDIKTGVKIVLLFAVFNKVAGIYGLIAIFTGGTLAQVSMYIYSVAALAGYYWGFKAIVEVRITLKKSDNCTSIPRRSPFIDNMDTFLWGQLVGL